MYGYFSNYLENILIKPRLLDKDTSGSWQELLDIELPVVHSVKYTYQLYFHLTLPNCCKY